MERRSSATEQRIDSSDIYNIYKKKDALDFGYFPIHDDKIKTARYSTVAPLTLSNFELNNTDSISVNRLGSFSAFLSSSCSCNIMKSLGMVLVHILNLLVTGRTPQTS